MKGQGVRVLIKVKNHYIIVSGVTRGAGGRLLQGGGNFLIKIWFWRVVQKFKLFHYF